MIDIEKPLQKRSTTAKFYLSFLIYRYEMREKYHSFCIKKVVVYYKNSLSLKFNVVSQ